MMAHLDWGLFIARAIRWVNLGLLVWTIRLLKRLIQHGIDDRAARMLAIVELKKTAEALERRTALLAKVTSDREAEAVAKQGQRFDSLDRELDRNSQLTQKAADASANAAEVANSVNDKIERTQQRLLEHVAQSEKKGDGT
jgi:hypothetical protein